jgi:hypothetical protein
MRRKWVWTLGLWMTAGALLWQGCSTPTRVTTVSQAGFSGARTGTIGVMPFFKGRHPSNVNENLNCTLCTLVFDPENVGTGADSTLTRYVYELAYARFSERILPQDTVMATYSAIPTDSEKDTPMTLARKVGQSIGANYMLFGTVWRYRDRSGSSASSKTAASVAFDLYLVDVRRGETVWMANFDETQRSLSDNIWDAETFFSRGAKWLSANELARFGVEEIMKQMPL